MKPIPKTKRNSCALNAIVLATLLVAAKTSAQPTGQWDFDSGNPVVIGRLTADVIFRDWAVSGTCDW